jgi:7-cyano-7-deazaguanine synthase in queuosine biosynthesis
MQSKRYVICGNVDFDVPSEYRDKTLRYHLIGKDDKHPRKVTLKIGDIRSTLFKEIPDRFNDLLEIATYVYCADQEIVRGQRNAETFGSYWRRHFHFVIPVRDTQFWQSAEVTNCLEQTLGFLSDDHYEFEFIEHTEKVTLQYYLDINENGAMLGCPEQVVMFSGGLDSLGGVVDEIINQKRRVVLVNHRSTGKLDKRYQALEGLIENKASESCKPTHIRVTVNKREDMNNEYTQRSRSFLFVTIGATIAKMLGLNSVRFYENGVISLNLPICAQVVGGKATRTTHPRVINGFQKLLSMVADKSFIVENPFINKTKGEVVELIGKAGCENMIGPSISCTHTWEMTLKHSHCGTCSQCIDRRFAIIAAGMEHAEPEDQYKYDVFAGCREKEKQAAEDKMVCASYLERANQADNVGDCIEFLSKFPEAARALKYLPGDPYQVSERIFSMYKKHSDEVNRVVDLMLARYSKEIRQRTLPDDCMIRIIHESRLPVSVSVVSRVQEDLPNNIFRRNGSAWQVRFNGGNHFIVLPTKGAEYLCTLLTRPNEQIPISDIVCGAMVNYCTHLIDVHNAEEQGMRVTANNPMFSAIGKVSNWKTVKECREEAARLLVDIEKARADNNNVEVEHCNEQISKLLSYINQATGIGKLKDAGDKRKSLSDGLRRSVKAIIKKIGEDDKIFADHLSQAIKYGYMPSYRSSPLIIWETQAVSDT